MIDPVLSLAFSMHSNKGVYALLLGSGVSRSARISTGWEITLDLTRKLARLKGEDSEPDAEAWYTRTFGEGPDYSKLLGDVAKSQIERQKLLRQYFEPNDEEKEQGLKMPTPAHVAMAKLVAGGFVKVIVTTNFDRLMEDALQEEGIRPDVISTIDAIKGATPLMHSDCTIVKVHGDYLDSRIKNTPDELKEYDRELDELLDRIFDEFGLIVCGWSAEWDYALRDAMSRCKSHRYTTFWTIRGNPNAKSEDLIKLRRAESIKIKGADEFFHELYEKVSALDQIDKPHPLSKKVAVASLKKYLADEKHSISLHDLVMEERNVSSKMRHAFPEFSVANCLFPPVSPVG